MQEVLAGPGQLIKFLVPWVCDASISFLWPPVRLKEVLTQVGFEEVEWVDEREVALVGIQAQASSRPRAGERTQAAQLMLGAQLPEMVRNVGTNFAEDRLTLVRAVLERL